MNAAGTGSIQKVVIVTGLSGAGKTTALKAFEDFGYEVVDNLPLSLLMRLLQTDESASAPPGERPIAVGVDSRTRAFSADAFSAQMQFFAGQPDLDATLIFFDCDDQTLSRRFSETRRRHPLALDRPIEDGIAHERELLAPIKELADCVLDSTEFTVHDLKRRLALQFSLEGTERTAISVMSFAYSRGLPRAADLIFDVRFLRNPNYVAELKQQCGRDEAVACYVAADANFSTFFERLTSLVTFLLPLFQAEGKSYLTIACGCTGGRHRSVFVTELLGKVLKERGYRANIEHREIAQWGEDAK